MEKPWDSIIFLWAYPWKGFLQTFHHLANHFTAHLPVLLVEFPPPWNPRDRYFDRNTLLLSWSPLRLRERGFGFSVLTPRTFPLGRRQRVKDWNRSLYVKDIRAALRKLGARKPLYWVFYMEGCVRNLEALGQPSWVYHCLDYMKNIDQAEEQAVSRGAAVVFAVSEGLVQKHRALNPRTYRFPNGVESMWFDPAGQEPAPLLADLPPGKPVIGFLGAIFQHLDLVLLEKVARAFPAAELVVVGPLRKGMYGPQGVQQEAFQRLNNTPNVRVLGFLPRQHLPRYVERFDVCLMPFLDDEFVRASDPLKFYEYSSRGKPVVTTPLSLADEHRALCYIATSHDEFLSHIERALAERGDPELAARRVAMAREHSWPVLVAEAFQRVVEVTGGEAPRG